MIVVEFSTPDESSVRIKVSGHSGSAEKGQDVVCAAVSVLVQTLAGGLNNSLGAAVTGRLEPGDSDLVIRVDNNDRKALKLVCEVFRYGFQKIFESYPEHLKLN
ncbi:MAG: uncharacterized protein PWR01_3174 [Clostridiales bacterium]|jgi:uncharacterized protein YsxB (DUF464 family)|nr:uncharacterized protein [Clostridiales bacterium]MDN5282101.1 uncharacterized protein [Candidatus Ozemobacter sp.]